MMTYYGLTSREFKRTGPRGGKYGRYYEHLHAIDNEESTHSTKLSNYVWKLKKAGRPYKIDWFIQSRAPETTSSSKKCILCIKEKTAIARHEDCNTLLNSRTESLSKCMHRNSFELRRLKRPPWDQGALQQVFFGKLQQPRYCAKECPQNFHFCDTYFSWLTSALHETLRINEIHQIFDWN